MKRECYYYNPDLMYNEEGSSGYIFLGMWSPGLTKFFFTTEGKPMISNKYPIMQYHLRKQVSNFTIQIKTNDELYPIIDVDIMEVNFMVNKLNTTLLSDLYESTVINCLPRPVPGCHIRPKVTKARIPWSIPI